MEVAERPLIRPPDTQRISWRPVIIAAFALVCLAILLHATNPERVAWTANFILVLSALLIEAIPFVLLGALVSAAIEVFVPPGVMGKLARLPQPLQLPVAALAGVAFPVCECGSVPVARRLAMKGLSPAAAITFMLAAPVANPIVITSTLVAYRGTPILWTMVLGRVGLGLIVAMTVGWVVARQSKQQLLRPRADDAPSPAEVAAHEHGGSKWRDYFGHVGGDFLFMGRYLMIGAAVAAAVQTFVPQSIIGSFANLPVVPLLAMMGLAWLLSLCSESDAFVAVTFVQFGPAAQLAFLVFGPMVDMKLAALYMGTYNRGFFRTVVIVVTAVTLVGTMWIQVFKG